MGKHIRGETETRIHEATGATAGTVRTATTATRIRRIELAIDIVDTTIEAIGSAVKRGRSNDTREVLETMTGPGQAANRTQALGAQTGSMVPTAI